KATGDAQPVVDAEIPSRRWETHRSPRHRQGPLEASRLETGRLGLVDGHDRRRDRHGVERPRPAQPFHRLDVGASVLRSCDYKSRSIPRADWDAVGCAFRPTVSVTVAAHGFVWPHCPIALPSKASPSVCRLPPPFVASHYALV